MEETNIDIGKITKNLFIRQNVFYLLSAFFMILGCYLALKPFQQVTRSLTDLFIYFALINSYEALLVIAAIYIIIKKNVVRDGIVLLFLECFFLADATLMNSVYYLYSAWAGLLFNGVILGLAGLKIFVIVRYLRLSFPAAFYRFIALGLSYLYLFTAFVSYGIKQPFDNDMLLYISWAVAGLIPALLIGISYYKEDPAAPFAGFRKKAQVIFSLVLIGILIVHLATVTWIFSATFWGCYLSTFLISLATVIPEFMPRLKEEKRFTKLQYALIIAGILTGIGFPDSLVFKSPVTFSPLTVSLAMSALAFLYFGLLYRRILFGVYSILLIATSTLGYEAGVIIERISNGIEWVFRQLPRTSKAWGILSIIMAFVLFVIGFLISLRKSKYQDPIGEQSHPTDADTGLKNVLKTKHTIKSTSKKWLTIIGIIFIILVLAAIAMPNFSLTRGLCNESSTIAALKMLVSQEAIWWQTDVDGNGIKDYWTMDVSCFHRFYCKGNLLKINLIDIAFARADSVAYSRNRPTPFNLGNESGLDLEDWSHPDGAPIAKSGYWFMAILLDEDGVLYNQNTVGKNGIKACNTNKFAFVAFPQVYEISGTNTFIVNETGNLYQTDCGSDANKVVIRWPGVDPTKVRGPGGKLWAVAE